MKEHTLVILKPDSLERHLTTKILSRYEDKGLKIVAMKMMKITPLIAKKHYKEHVKKSFFKELLAYITRGPVIVLILQGENAVVHTRQINGATDPLEAASGSIRGLYARDKTANLVHASDSVKAAKKEIAIFFKKHEIYA